MKLGLISDTHIPERQKSLPGEIIRLFKDVDLILHAGDITSQKVLDDLNVLAPVKAVQGNMDQTGIVTELPRRIRLSVNGKIIALTHGWGSPHGIRRRIKESLSDLNPDVIVHGHTHQPYIDHSDNVLWINPGSPTDKIVAPFQSVAILNIDDDGRMNATIKNIHSEI